MFNNDLFFIVHVAAVQPAVKFLGYVKEDFPQAELACEEALSLPVFPEFLTQEREFVLEAIKNYFPN